MRHTNQPPVTLVEVGEVQTTEAGRPYFVARFKRGAFGKAVSRTFWSKESDGSTIWDRVSPDDLTPLIGHDISSEVSIEAVEIEPEEFVSPTTGEVHEITSKTIVRFSDETLEQAVRRSGSVLRQHENTMLDADTTANAAAPQMPANGAFTVVGLNGRGMSQR
jgi:hypothetical protein